MNKPGSMALLALLCAVGCAESKTLGEGTKGVNHDGPAVTSDADHASPAVAGSGAPELVEPLCNGTDQIRLGLLSSPGSFSVASYAFKYPFGGGLAVVDGRCRYFVDGPRLGGIRSGVLDEPTARALADEVGFHRLAEWQKQIESKSQSGGCFDGGSSIIRGPSASVSCMCSSCGADAPDGLQQAMEARQRWWTRLYDQGSPLSGPLRVATERENFVTSGTVDWMILAWPMSWPASQALATTVPITMSSGALTFSADAGLLIEDAADAATLRALRDRARVIPAVSDINVMDGDAGFRVYVRDELPDDVSEAIRAFSARSG